MGIQRDKPNFESEQELQDWLISFYEKKLIELLNNMGGITEHKVKVTPTLIKVTMHRYSQLLERYSVTDWEQS